MVLKNICPSEIDEIAVDFDCGLHLSNLLLDAIDEADIEQINKIHQRHHDQGHKLGAYSVRIKRHRDASLTSECWPRQGSCWDEGGL